MQNVLRFFAYFGVSFMMTACGASQRENPTSATKYLALTEANPGYYGARQDQLLITKIHKDIQYTVRVLADDFNQWQADMPQADCLQNTEARRLTGDAIGVWLQALQQEANAGQLKLNHKVGKPVYTTSLEKADITVYFTCEVGRSHFSFDDEGRAYIKFSPKLDHYGVGEALKTRNQASESMFFNIGVLRHEFGHAFGLDDAYVDTGDGRKGLLPTNALMATSIGTSDLTPDDRAGMVWLYRRLVAQDVEAGTCLPGFIRDAASKGCYLAAQNSLWARQTCQHSGGTPTADGLCYCAIKLATYDAQYESPNYCRPLDQLGSTVRRGLSILE